MLLQKKTNLEFSNFGTKNLLKIEKEDGINISYEILEKAAEEYSKSGGLPRSRVKQLEKLDEVLENANITVDKDNRQIIVTSKDGKKNHAFQLTDDFENVPDQLPGKKLVQNKKDEIDRARDFLNGDGDRQRNVRILEKAIELLGKDGWEDWEKSKIKEISLALKGAIAEEVEGEFVAKVSVLPSKVEKDFERFSNWMKGDSKSK